MLLPSSHRWPYHPLTGGLTILSQVALPSSHRWPYHSLTGGLTILSQVALPFSHRWPYHPLTGGLTILSQVALPSSHRWPYHPLTGGLTILSQVALPSSHRWPYHPLTGGLTILSQVALPSSHRWPYHPNFLSYGPVLPQGILNPLQGFFNALAYGNICQFCSTCCENLRGLCCKRVDPYISSWSGEYIDVDFRVDRGNIKRTSRKTSN